MKVIISYEWWSSRDRSEPAPEHREALQEAAEERIFSQLREGYTAGQLLHEQVEADQEDEVAYQGWWSTTSTENT